MLNKKIKDLIKNKNFTVVFSDCTQIFKFGECIDDTYQILDYTLIDEFGTHNEQDVSLIEQDIYFINAMLNNGTNEISIEVDYSTFEWKFNNGTLA